jgi:hypothetical protein
MRVNYHGILNLEKVGFYNLGNLLRYCFITLAPAGPNVIKLFTAVIYCHSMVIPSFCVIKQHYLGNYGRMAVNYCGISVTNVIKHDLT